MQQNFATDLNRNIVEFRVVFPIVDRNFKFILIET